MNINQIIFDAVGDYNKVRSQLSEHTGRKLRIYRPEDYNYLETYQSAFGNFIIPYFLTHAVQRKIELRTKDGYEKTIRYWQKDKDEEKAKEFLNIQTKLLSDTLITYESLMKAEQWLAALIIFRSFIEYSSQYYTCLMDYDFFKKYTESTESNHEYRQHWFKNLKPEKVLSRLRKMNLL